MKKYLKVYDKKIDLKNNSVKEFVDKFCTIDYEYESCCLYEMNYNEFLKYYEIWCLKTNYQNSDHKEIYDFLIVTKILDKILKNTFSKRVYVKYNKIYLKGICLKDIEVTTLSNKFVNISRDQRLLFEFYNL